MVVTISDSPWLTPGNAILPNPRKSSMIRGPRSRAGFSEVIVSGAVVNTSTPTVRPTISGKNHDEGALTLRLSSRLKMTISNSPVAKNSTAKPCQKPMLIGNLSTPAKPGWGE
jgi:hypothetical protein